MTFRAALIVIVGIGVVACGEHRGVTIPGENTLVGCPLSVSHPPRWAGQDAPYEETDQYGGGQEDGIMTVAGLATGIPDDVYVLDALDGEVLRLSGRLKPKGTFGRPGDSPPELWRTGRILKKASAWNWLSASDSAVYVFDGTNLGVFSRSGRFLRRLRLPPGMAVNPVAMRRLQAAGNNVILGIDDLGPHAGPGRRLVTWLTGASEEHELYALPLEGLPRMPSGATYAGPDQAYPLWGYHAGCLYLSSGGPDSLVQVDIARQTTRRIGLPQPGAPVPSVGDSRGATYLSIRLGLGPVHNLPAPTAPRVWDDIAVDPDGWVWLLPRQNGASPRDGIVVVQVSPEGTPRLDTVPAFPKAFGDPGAYYAVSTDPATGLGRVSRYGRSGSSEGVVVRSSH